MLTNILHSIAPLANILKFISISSNFSLFFDLGAPFMPKGPGKFFTGLPPHCTALYKHGKLSSFF